ncbi:MAG: glutaredoxin family protein [Porticoccaceae bacterium]
MSNDKNRKVVTLYIGESCHLCDQARQVVLPVIADTDWVLEEVVITGDEALMAAYDIRIPVVKTSAGVEKGWPFTPGQIKRLITGVDS